MTFLQDVLHDLKNKNQDFSEVVFVLPSKRAGVFLRYYLAHYIDRTAFAPNIISIEDFVKTLSGLKQISSVELLFQFYASYKRLTPKEEIEPFEAFSHWAKTIIQDFNEVDRYVVKPNAIFDYLSAIKTLDHWSKAREQTELVSNYVKFWKRLKTYYVEFTNDLIQQGLGYQGLVYREALANIESFIQNNSKTHVFVGFNALNTAEERIIQELLHNDMALTYWDIDKTFINDNLHGASHFLRDYKKRWPYFSSNNFNWITSNYNQPKSIEVIGCPQTVGQSKYVGNILKRLKEKGHSFENTAVVLGDESLLMPVLNSLPENIGPINVTMGFPLRSIPLASIFEQLFRIHKTNANRFYYKNVIPIVSHQTIRPLLGSASRIIETIRQNNMVYLSIGMLKDIANPRDSELLELLFKNWDDSIDNVLKKCVALIHKMKAFFQQEKHKSTLELEYLHGFYTLFNELDVLNNSYGYIADVSALHAVYKELLNAETLDFQGEPLDGLQIMGMLESRVLDFETVIITSVNEGILPAGKSHNSFIPFDVKLEHRLPTFKEKDAIYTYHFFRLLQRAKTVYIIYNTEIDALKGGEKSRFITQLEIEGIHNITYRTIAPSIQNTAQNLLEIKEDDAIREQLIVLAQKGFSPSALTNYIRNPIDFYYEKILGIKEMDDVEETTAANTLGTVIHKTLQDLYEPLIGRFLQAEDIDVMPTKVEDRIVHHFKAILKKGDIQQGKNLISFEVAKRYVVNILKLEKQSIADGNSIKIIAVETKVETDIHIPELNFPVKLKGEIDRVDEYNGTMRIIDYKTGKVLQSNLEVIDWETITKDYNAHSKVFQVLMYSYILNKEQRMPLPVEAGIISFKNLQQGFLKFAKKEAPRGAKETQITQDILQAFEAELKQLIIEICNPSINFVEKLIE